MGRTRFRVPLLAIGVALMVVAVGSLIAFPVWTANPASLLVLLAVAAAGVVAFLRNLSGLLRDYSELTSPAKTEQVVLLSASNAPDAMPDKRETVSTSTPQHAYAVAEPMGSTPSAPVEILHSK